MQLDFTGSSAVVTLLQILMRIYCSVSLQIHRRLIRLHLAIQRIIVRVGL